MQGTVYKSTGSWYSVKDADRKFYNARMKGIFKMDDITSTNPIAVGDVVDFEMENEGEQTVIIHHIHDRRNYINRQSPRAKSQQHIVAANVDQAMMIATIREPRTSQGFIDRFLVACEMYHVPAIVMFNKIDVYKEKDLQKLEKLSEVYRVIGYQVIAVSMKHGGVDEVRTHLSGKTTVVSGHSGVGKSTFINSILPGQQIKTQDISGWSGKGQHTTTFAEMYDLNDGNGGRIIDTPGMKEFGIVGVEKQELSGYFPEMREQLNQCQFNNCLHINEPGCAIKESVMNGQIDEDRYVSYVNILESIEEEKWK
jgi:ribosome biogenesis GTPase